MKLIPAALLCMSLLVPASYAGTPGEVDVGGVLREARLYPLNGPLRKLSDFRGKPLLINVWASWCGPCRAEMGSLESLSRLDRKKQFRVIGISTDDDAIAASEFVVKSKLSFENFVDDRLMLENMLGANTIPLTVLVDGNGRVLRKVRGSHDWTSREYVGLVEHTFGIKIER